VLRHAARVVLLDDRDRILLLKWRLLTGGHVWITPGGGLLAGESHPEGALRELEEEVGLRGAHLGPCVWLRDHVLQWGERTIRQRERFYLVRVTEHAVDRSANDEQELQVIEEIRWWSLAEIETSAEDFSPRAMATFLKPLLAGMIPDHPLDVSV
jgi:8-oxo-dGTP pyrophosphatase MutT (NUDIX family)